MDNSRDYGTSNGLAGATGQTGNFYVVEDSDSTWTVAFDPVDATGFTDLLLNFTWAIDNDGGGSTAGSNFEESDFIEVTVNGESVFKVDGAGDYDVGDAVGGLDDLDAPYINAFTPENIDISAYDGQILNISFAIANNSAPEDIAFDNVMVTSVPEPGSLTLLVLGSLLLFFRRQRT
ncbi:MAG: PEP-CTERM sorting domain-containing protein [Pirellulaceae bacterium]|nr:PEP-CTERM sorting domain-containing protein [Pirellulaceae bacterium]